MILYFSATGNSLAAAHDIAVATNDKIEDMGTACKTGKFTFYVSQGENLGFVFPVHAWSTPGLVDVFLRKAHFITDNGNPFTPGYCYCVITCGAFVGNAARFFGEMLEKYQGLHLDASYSIHSVGNCVYLYAPLEGVKMRERLQEADRATTEIAAMISSKHMGPTEKRNPLGILMSKVTCREEKPRSIEPFHVIADRCTHCGSCVALCPTNTIHLDNQGLPVWSGDACTQCLACLHRCPTAATQYGNKTEGRGRYTNPILKGAAVRDPRVIPEIG